MAPFEVRHGLGQRAPLDARYFIQRRPLLDLRLHPFHKSFRAEVNLSLQLRPYARQPGTFMHESNVFADGAGALPTELREDPVCLQPLGRARLAAGNTRGQTGMALS